MIQPQHGGRTQQSCFIRLFFSIHVCRFGLRTLFNIPVFFGRNKRDFYANPLNDEQIQIRWIAKESRET